MSPLTATPSRIQAPAQRVLALCAGYGGLEIAIGAGIGTRVVAFAENDPFAAAVFAAHHPGIPNLGDITGADWHAVRDFYRPDVVGAGFPCRNISNAGRRDGIGGRWSKIWKNVAAAVGVLRPRLVFLENVAAIRSRGLDVVAADLAALGYDARWTCLRAGDPEVGAPHARDRWFCVAHPADADPDDFGRNWRPWHLAQAARDWKSGASNLIGVNSRPLNEVVVNLLPTPKASDGPHGGPNQRDGGGRYYLPGQAVRLDERWIATDGTDYGPAIHRWETITGRPAPCPTEPGTRGNRRLNPEFGEWMMGLPSGHVTDLDLPRTEQLRIIGNGAVPQQAHHAYGLLLGAHMAGTAPTLAQRAA
ncbi:DNA cytosine methyltransferase [Sphaerisporangium corydalis]|uniref:DNA (cytosine-5-)-methyltransferase n=1 Tax=Sphaerisporangium corydalis TaxID=1441875 RepID=A0ABV9EJK7_9ACTN|nr:DNA cytosine methyltransferase [Sphaerisporangium corydalis]